MTTLTITATFLIIIGFIIGLGAVTVIDIHGFLGRKSAYWTQATTRTHKITKPLIWIGTILFVIGFSILYEGQLLLIQSAIAVVMILNGIFLSFSVSPFLLKREKEGLDAELLPKFWQTKITASFIVSFLSWWGSVALFVLLYMF
jgi:predicted RND superfamily exporter protein